MYLFQYYILFTYYILHNYLFFFHFCIGFTNPKIPPPHYYKHCFNLGKNVNVYIQYENIYTITAIIVNIFPTLEKRKNGKITESKVDITNNKVIFLRFSFLINLIYFLNPINIKVPVKDNKVPIE